MFLRSHAKDLKGKIFSLHGDGWHPLPKNVNEQIVEWRSEAMRSRLSKFFSYPETEMNGERIVYYTSFHGDGTLELERIMGVTTKFFYDIYWGQPVDGETGNSGFFPPDYSI